MINMKIFVLNLGGTSGKVAVFDNDICQHDHSFSYSEAEVALEYTGREEVAIKAKHILNWLESVDLRVEDLDAFAIRGSGLFYGGEGGTFLVEGALREQVERMYSPSKHILHASYIAVAVVDELQKGLLEKKPIYSTDPGTINHLLPEARLTGYPEFIKRAAFHALNHRAVARKAAADLGKPYEELNLIVVHAGGGVSIGAHQKGRIVDVNDANGDGDGPFTPNRAGGLPTGPLVHLCFSGKYTEKEVFKLLKGESGLKAYLGTEDLREVEKRIDRGDSQAELVFKALSYQICREIGACFATMCCAVDAIVMTAGLSYSDRLVESIQTRVGKIAPILRYPGGFENEALALGAYRVLSGQEQPAIYRGETGHVPMINPN